MKKGKMRENPPGKCFVICAYNLTDIGPVSITTDPEKFQKDLQELFVQVGNKTCKLIIL